MSSDVGGWWWPRWCGRPIRPIEVGIGEPRGLFPEAGDRWPGGGMCMLGGEAAGGGCGATTGGCGDDICLGGDGELRSLLDESMTESMLIVVRRRGAAPALCTQLLLLLVRQ